MGSGLKTVANYFKTNPYRIVLVIIFSVLYLPHAFILISDLNLISAYEVDPGSMIAALEGLFTKPIYNMMNGYHSRYYGWTYFSINFFLLLPLQLVAAVFKIKSKVFLYFSIKVIFFIIGLISSLLLFEINNFVSNSKNRFVSFLITILYVVSPLSYFFFFIHPETTGGLFFFAAIICLINCFKNFSLRLYYCGIVFLVLSTLSKQIFFFTSLPLIFCFLYSFYKHTNLKFFSLLKTKEFLRVGAKTLALPILVLFIVHPYSIISFQDFLKYQGELSTSFTKNISVGFTDSLINWFTLIKGDPVMFLLFSLTPVVFVASIYSFVKKTSQRDLFYAVLCSSALLVLLIVAHGNRLVYLPHYLFPIYLILILNLQIFVNLLTTNISSDPRFIRNVFRLSIVFLIAVIAYDSYQIIPGLYSRLNYKNSSAYISYIYIKNNLTEKDRVAHDQLITIPVELNQISCHFWRGCGTDYIEEFNPNYVIFNAKYILEHPSREADRLKKYVTDHKMVLVTQLSTVNDSFVESERNNRIFEEIMVYKKLVSH